MNNHYNGTFLEPWGERSQRGYGIEVLERFVREVAYVEFGGPADERTRRLSQMRQLAYNDLAADRQTVAAVQAMEAILARHAAGTARLRRRRQPPRRRPGALRTRRREPEVLYAGA